jgi:hypothetical protein
MIAANEFRTQRSPSLQKQAMPQGKSLAFPSNIEQLIARTEAGVNRHCL